MDIIKESTIGTNPTIVWDVLTKPEYIEKWLGVKAESNWKANSELLFKFSWDGKEFIDKAVILNFDVNKLFVYSYWSNFSGLPDTPENYSKIHFELDKKDEKTLLKLRHSEIKNQTMYEHSNKNWEETLNEIKKISESIKQ